MISTLTHAWVVHQTRNKPTMHRVAFVIAQRAQALRSLAGRAAESVPSPTPELQEAIQAIRKGLSHAPQARWSHCSCSGDLTLPPPQKVLVEYSPAEVDNFIEFADAVEEEFQGIIVDGTEVVDAPPHSFDVKMEDGQLVFSRAAEGSGGLPAYSDLFERLRRAGLQAAAA